jgi:indole-3-glycerol phosphate synthase
MILDRILATKQRELVQRQEQISLGDLERRIPSSEVISFTEAIRKTDVNIISEIKYNSPSHGAFLCQDPPEELAGAYVKNGAAALSILTDETFFGGSLDFLERVSGHLTSGLSDRDQDGAVPVPLLRKDFILDRYQVLEARCAGASAFLLIVACLHGSVLRELQATGRDYGLEALVEVHDRFELETALDAGATLVGVNNRDLRSFEVNVNTSFEIARELEGESGPVLVAESGISDASLIAELRDAGFSAFLIGTAFMDSPNPAEQLRKLLVENAG